MTYQGYCNPFMIVLMETVISVSTFCLIETIHTSFNFVTKLKETVTMLGSQEDGDVRIPC